ncbi:MAG TPA: response regulator [Caulobacteraceae bacterium]|nr:response regulator [Caulobacteraceae bacterium]
MSQGGPLSQRVLVLAPAGRDAAIAASILREAGHVVEVCADLACLCRDLVKGAALAVVVEEALHGADLHELSRWIESQPAWSDFPFVLLAHRGGGLERNPGAKRLSGVLGNVSFLERPFHPTTLVSVVATSLRGRLRQYEARERLESLREAEERFRTMAETIPQLAWMADPEGSIFWYNRRWYDFTGTDLEQMRGWGWTAVHHAEHMDRVVESYGASVRSGQPWEDLFPLRSKDGEYRWFLSRARPMHDAEGRITGWFGTNTDVTEQQEMERLLERRVAERTAELESANRQLASQIAERERVEKALRQAQRLEAVGQLTSGVAHDFNNLLTVVLGNVRQMQKSATDPVSARRLAMMGEAAERGAKLTAQMLAFSRRQKLEPRSVDLNETVASMRDLLQSTMGGSVRIETVLAPRLWPAMIDPTQIELVILNLAINARDAMTVGGALTVETANVTLGEPRRPEEPPAGDYVMVAVSDTGSGMSEEVLGKAFEPFFTTKEVGKGSGLGLSQVFGLAKQSGGGVRIDTREGEGTSVKVYLPRAAEGAVGDKAAGVRAAAADPHGAVVLLVDDDSAVREVTAGILGDLGYAVIEAGSGGAALEALEGEAEVDLVLLDFAMPGMNGAEVAREVKARRPHLPILFATGYADAAALTEAEDERIVHKPFVEDELALKLAAAVGPREARGNVVRLKR